MELEQKSLKNVLVLSIAGNLDTQTSEQFQELLSNHIEDGVRRIVIDCSRLVYISSSGLRALMVGVRRLKPVGGQLSLSSMPSHLADSLQISGILDLFMVFGTVEEAVDALE